MSIYFHGTWKELICVPVNQIFRAKVKGSLAAREGFHHV